MVNLNRAVGLVERHCALLAVGGGAAHGIRVGSTQFCLFRYYDVVKLSVVGEIIKKCSYLYINIHIYISTIYICVCVYVCVYIYICVHVHVYIYIFAYYDLSFTNRYNNVVKLLFVGGIRKDDETRGWRLSKKGGKQKYSSQPKKKPGPVRMAQTPRAGTGDSHPKTLNEMWIICLDPVSANSNSEKCIGSPWALRVGQRLPSRFGQSGEARELGLAQIVVEASRIRGGLPNTWPP